MKYLRNIIFLSFSFVLGYLFAIHIEVRGPLQDESIYSNRTNRALKFVMLNSLEEAEKELRWLSYAHSNRYFIYRKTWPFYSPDDVFCSGFYPGKMTSAEYNKLFGDKITDYIRSRLKFCQFDIP